METLKSNTEFLTIQEAADYLKVRPATLYAWVHQRTIPFRKHGSRVVFEAAELRAWSEKRRVPEHLSARWEAADKYGTDPTGSLKIRRTTETP